MFDIMKRKKEEYVILIFNILIIPWFLWCHF